MSQVGNFSGGGGGSNVMTLTGNTGGAVGVSSGNINIVGSGSVTVTGNPGTNTLTITSSGTSVLNYTSVSSTPYTVLSTDVYLGVNSTSSAFTIDLPNAPTTGEYYIIKDSYGTAATNPITITTVGGTVLIDGSPTFVMNTNYESINVIFNGTSYEVF